MSHRPTGAPTAAASEVTPPKIPSARPSLPADTVPGTAALARTTKSPKPMPPLIPARTRLSRGGPTTRPSTCPSSWRPRATRSAARSPSRSPSLGANGWTAMTPTIIVVSTAPPVTVESPSATPIETIVE